MPRRHPDGIVSSDQELIKTAAELIGRGIAPHLITDAVNAGKTVAEIRTQFEAFTKDPK